MAFYTFKVPRKRKCRRKRQLIPQRQAKCFAIIGKSGQKCQVSCDPPIVRKKALRPTRSNKNSQRKTCALACSTKQTDSESSGGGDGNDKRLDEKFENLVTSDFEKLLCFLNSLLVFCETLQVTLLLNQFLASSIQANLLSFNFGRLDAKKAFSLNPDFDDQLNAVAIRLACREKGLRMELLDSQSLEHILAALPTKNLSDKTFKKPNDSLRSARNSEFPLNQDHLAYIYLLVCHYFVHSQSRTGKKE